MDAERAIKILERQRAAATPLYNVESGSPCFTKWKRDTEVAIERIFSPDSRNINDFKNIRYSPIAFSLDEREYVFHEAYVSGLREADAILSSMIDEIREYAIDENAGTGTPDLLNLIERICLRFHATSRQLQQRHMQRPTISIDDEYDVQDLLHALLRLHFDDIRSEEWTPSYGGRSARVDFLLKKERIVIEVKKTRPNLKGGEIGEQLIIDRARYERHPDCETLVCFVYDPEGRIGNPVGLERDLEDNTGRIKVRVIVSPKT